MTFGVSVCSCLFMFYLGGGFVRFGIVMWSCLWFVWKLYKNVQNNQVIQLFHQGARFLVFAIGVWLFDSNLCFVYDYVPNPQLHAW
jgi:dihydroceramidase